MSAKLANILPDSFLSPADKENFFSVQERANIRKNDERREINDNPLAPCDTNLFLGFFFDGTGNNFADSLERGDNSQSNVARLYGAFPGLSVPGVLPSETDWQTNMADYDNYFRIYLPGIGTRFEQVDDSGEGFWDATLGGGTGRLGQVRITWALAQAINTVSRYFTKSPFLISHQQAENLGQMAQLGSNSLNSHTRHVEYTFLHGWLSTLHQAIAPHMPDKDNAGLPQNKDPGIVKNIYISTFGFSRGSALARVFTNWLIQLCELDARMTGNSGLTLGGFRVTFDFLGLFDTVASVGIPSLISFASGHFSWANAERTLSIDSRAGCCLHLVAAHENRRSFPLDSIYNDHSIPANGEEIVYPGVHSDIGGGYAPLCQGKGIDPLGKDMLSRIPLAEMYRQARLSGVPFKLEQAESTVQDSFKVDAAMIGDFNRYIEQCEIVSGDTGKIVREHWEKTIEWRFDNHQHGGIEVLKSYQRASDFERNELKSAYEGFEEELERYDEFKKYKEKELKRFDGVKTLEQAPKKEISLADFMQMGPGWALKSQSRIPGADPSVINDWLKIIDLEPGFSRPSEAVSVMMDHYVHDSVAGFRPLGKFADRDEAITYLKTLVKRKNNMVSAAPPRYMSPNIAMSGFETSQMTNRLTDVEIKRAEYYERTGRIPEMTVGGRESYLLGGGYLRFRRIYAGADDQLLAILAPEHQPGYRASLFAENSKGRETRSEAV